MELKLFNVSTLDGNRDNITLRKDRLGNELKIRKNHSSDDIRRKGTDDVWKKHMGNG